MGCRYTFLASKAVTVENSQDDIIQLHTVIETLHRQDVSVITNDSLRLHASHYKDEWQSHFLGYAGLTERGVLIIADTEEQLDNWRNSAACQAECAGVPEERLFIYNRQKIIPKASF